MPFGLRNAAQTFQRFIDQVLHDLPFCFRYIDDLLIASSSPEEYRQHLRLVLQCLDNHGILINVPKCVFGILELDFLGYHVDVSGVRPMENRVHVIRDFPRPNSQRKLREFLGLVNFYRRFIPDGAMLLKPLNQLLSRSTAQTLDWPDAAIEAFDAVKNAFAQATLLVHPKMGHPPAS